MVLQYEHVLKMINHFNEVEINGANIDEKTQVGMILETVFPYSFNSGQTIGKANVAEANVATGKVSSKQKKNMGKMKGKKKIQKKKGKATEPKAKGKCFHCNVDDHWKRNCKKYLDELKQKKKQGKFDLLVMETCLVENKPDN
ncbi:hypothetical protein ZIOFF_055245 [Zingiber officinale]|uniref:Gag/pol protein n=1 Tax=Zingiber officinale TaxID=94328 RepID=A0A8J5KND0_ZINOF|nr:hypothetical protein ZIOFF_055245 [Zingiber officinale]